MNYIENAIRVLTDPNDPNDESIRQYEREVLRDYYAKNKEAHREYIDKGIYEIMPEMAGFKDEMEQIEKILSDTQLKLFK